MEETVTVKISDSHGMLSTSTLHTFHPMTDAVTGLFIISHFEAEIIYPDARHFMAFHELLLSNSDIARQNYYLIVRGKRTSKKELRLLTILPVERSLTIRERFYQ